MPYTPDWEPLADALRRVIATGVGDTEARTDLCRAVADRKIRVQVTIAASEGRLADAVFSGQRVLVPARLNPNDFDWEQSHPHRPWTVGGSVVGPELYYDPYRTWERRQIGLIELATADVQRLFGSSPAKPKRQAAAETPAQKIRLDPNNLRPKRQAAALNRIVALAPLTSHVEPARCHRCRKSLDRVERRGKR